MVEFVRNPVGGVFFVVVIFWMSSLLGSIFIMGPFLPLLFIYTPLYRKLNDYLLACWICFPLAFLEKVYGIKIVVSGDAFKHGDKSVIIMNHRTRLDWLFFWSCLIRRSQLHYEKIMLKNELKHAPGGGWAMQVAAFIFVHRRWELDKAILSDVVDYFSALRHPTQILMFPEGTDLSERNRERNAVYAKKNGLPVYDYVLHPRTTGFTFLVESLRKNNMLDAVHDVSVAYPQNLPQREIDILKGDFPREIHFHIKRHPIATLPIDEEGLQKWCNEQWSEKEEVLKEFYKNKRFVNVENVETGISTRIQVSFIAALAFYIVYNTIVVVLMYTYRYLQFYFVIVSVFYFFVDYYFGGLEKLEVLWYNKYSSTYGIFTRIWSGKSQKSATE